MTAPNSSSLQNQSLFIYMERRGMCPEIIALSSTGTHTEKAISQSTADQPRDKCEISIVKSVGVVSVPGAPEATPHSSPSDQMLKLKDNVAIRKS